MRRLISCPLVVFLVVAIHLDWHVARPHHMRMSLDWDGHWLLALPVFALAAAYLRRRRPDRPWAAAAANLLLAALGAQVVEPLAEELYYDGRFALMMDPLRWTVFAELMAAGVVTLAAGVVTLAATVAAMEWHAHRRHSRIRPSGPAA